MELLFLIEVNKFKRLESEQQKYLKKEISD